ncbi:protein SICKLE [Abrus precatorius]|uniref:Protein SICKLE n=1 Tax=Abrus precatorius TaxID=3816 RepID=A0A8B8JL44_ABRPR|nr:protein SICKLE [Abrus precatorius]XP_027332196.1 protein SICKLE [Abrus precatorius]
MEDSEQRKKRLKEMRMQADQAEVSGGIEGSRMPGLLSNPLVEAPSTMPSLDRSYAAPRFDFYTDPMSAFSSNKRSNTNIQARPDNFPPPNFGGSPMVQYSSPHLESTNTQMTPPPTQVSPAAYRNPVWSGPRGPAPHNFPYHPSRGGTYSSPRFEPAGRPLYNPAQGITYRPSYSPNPSPGYRNSPGPSQGRGRGFWNNTRNPVSGRGSGQGVSFHGHWSNEDRSCGPDRFYKRSMVEDPWKHLKPVIWMATVGSLNTTNPPENSKPWTSKSTSMKREGSSAVSVNSNPGPSLAEYLAAALNEAANDAEDV